MLSGLAHNNGNALGDGPGDHARAARVVSSPACIREDGRRRHPERHLGRPDRRAAARLADALRARSSSAATTRAPSATATRATAAPTPTAWRGAATDDAACRRRPTRALVFERLFGDIDTGLDPGDARAAPALPPQHPRSRRRAHARRCATTSAPTDRRKLDEYLDVDPRDRAAHRSRPSRTCTDLAAEHRQADRHPGAVSPTTSTLMFDLQLHRVPDRLDARRRR